MTLGGITHVARIDARLAPYDWAFPREEAVRIDAHWAAQCRLKPGLFDGRVLLAHRFAIEDDRLAVSFFEVSFRSFLAWRDFGFPGEEVANCFAMAALRSADGAFMLGEMSPTTSNGGQMYFPAGTPDLKDVTPDGRVDLDGSFIRELEEETGLAPGDVDVGLGWTIVPAPTRPALACMKLVTAKDDAMQLQARLAAMNATLNDPELSRLVPVRSRGDLDPGHMPDFMIRYLSDALAG